MRHNHQYCRNFIIHHMISPQRTCIIVNYWSISPSTHWRSSPCCHNGGPCVNMDAIIMVWTTTECTSSLHPGSQMVLSGIQRGESVSEEDRFCRRQPWSNFIKEVGSGGGVNCVDPESYYFLRESIGRFFTSSRDFFTSGM